MSSRSAVMLSRIVVITLPLLISCNKPFNFRTENAELVSVRDLPSNFKMPSKVWELIEADEDKPKAEERKDEKKAAAEKPSGKAEGKAEAKGEPAAEKPKGSSPPILYSSAQVFLTEKNTGVLKTPSYHIDLPVGGGSLDLSDYVTGNPGSFFVGFELPEEFQTGTNFKAIFLSQGRKRKIEDRIFGAGCSVFMDITSKFVDMMKTEGIRANTTRQRHVTLLAGHYVFSVLKEGRLHITQATITDSKNKNLLCEAL